MSDPLSQILSGIRSLSKRVRKLERRSAGGSSGGGHTIEEEGVDLTQRDTINLIGAGITGSDDSTNEKTLVWVDFNIHSQNIPEDDVITIPENTSSIVAGALIVEGELVIDGTMLVL